MDLFTEWWKIFITMEINQTGALIFMEKCLEYRKVGIYLEQ